MIKVLVTMMLNCIATVTILENAISKLFQVLYGYFPERLCLHYSSHCNAH